MLLLVVLVAAFAVACSRHDAPATSPAATASVARSPSRPPVITDIASAPTPGFRNQFVNDEGRFWVSPYDDRAMSDDAKRQNPVTNPAWEPFATCMEQAGIVVRSEPDAAFTQVDLDRLLAKLNAEYPDIAANKKLPLRFTGAATDDRSAFLICAGESLTKSAKEIYDTTGVPNDYYPVPTVTPVR